MTLLTFFSLSLHYSMMYSWLNACTIIIIIDYYYYYLLDSSSFDSLESCRVFWQDLFYQEYWLSYNNTLTFKVYYKTLMLMYYNCLMFLSLFFILFSYCRWSQHQYCCGLSGHEPTGSEVVWLHEGLHGPVVSLRILKILQTESSVEYRSKSWYIDYSHNFECKICAYFHVLHVHVKIVDTIKLLTMNQVPCLFLLWISCSIPSELYTALFA